MKKRILAWCLIGVLSIGDLPVYAEESTEMPAETVQAEVTSVESNTETEETVEQSIESTEVYSEEKITVEETVEATTVEATEETAIEENFENAGAETIIASGTCGEHLTWTLDDAGTLAISGYGNMDDYIIYSDEKGGYITTAPWENYRAETKKLCIEEGIESIGEYAFRNCGSLGGELVLPDSVTSIGTAAFWGCSGFTGDLIIPNSVTYIGARAFWGCSGFTGKLKLSDNITAIQSGTFYGCNGLSGDLVIPNKVVCIANGAFLYCSNFKGKLVIPDGVTSIGSEAFMECGGLSGDLLIPDSVQIIGESAFKYTKFNGKFKLSKNMTRIEKSAFHSGSHFSGDLDIPDGVTDIAEQAFYGCYFEGELNIPNSVTRISESAFSMTHFTGNLIIPDSVTSMGSSVFLYCTGFTDIYFRGNFPKFDIYTFLNTTATVYYPENNPTWTSDVMKDYGGTLTWKPWNPDGQGTIPVTNDYIIERVRAYTSGQMSDRLNALLGSDLPFELRFQKINELFCNYGMLDAKEGIAYLRDTLDERWAFEAMTTKEFEGLCNKYSIEQGKGVEIPKFGTIPTGVCGICGKEDGVTGFVTRLYKVCLNRKPDAGGLTDWRTRLCEHTSSGREVAYGFIFSQEFIGKKYNNSDYVEYLYEAFMGRSSDAAGKKMWVDLLNTGWTREQVFDGFVGSDEFTKICNSYGIVRD